MKLPTYIINLAGAIERREAIAKQCSKVPFLETTFVTAVSGKELCYSEASKLGYNKQERSRRFNNDMSLNEIACFLSHRYTLELFLKSGDPHCLILEDDALFSSSFESVVSYLINKTKGWDLIDLEPRKTSLSGHFITALNDKNSLYIPKKIGSGTTALLYSREGALKTHSTLNTFFDGFDMHLINAHWSNNLYVAQVFPAIVTEDNFQSTIGLPASTRNNDKQGIVTSLMKSLRRTSNSIQKRIHLLRSKTKITIKTES